MTRYARLAKEYLRTILDADIEIEAMRFRIEELTNTAEMCGAIVTSDKVQSSPKQDTMERAITRLVEERTRLAERIDEWVEKKADCMAVLATMQNPLYKQVLVYRYVMRKRWGRIMKELNYSYDHLMTLHRNALDDLGRILEQKGASDE